MINLFNIEFIAANSTGSSVLLYFLGKTIIRYLSALPRAFRAVPVSRGAFLSVFQGLSVNIYLCTIMHIYVAVREYHVSQLMQLSPPPQRAILFISTGITFILKIVFAALTAEASVLQLKTGKNMLFSVFRKFM